MYYRGGVFEENEGWHRADVIFAGNVFAFVDVDFQENHVGLLSSQLLQETNTNE